MNASTYFSFPQHWTAHDLANAVPLRLSQMLDFDACRDGSGAASANTTPKPRQAWQQHVYSRAAALPLFRIR